MNRIIVVTPDELRMMLEDIIDERMKEMNQPLKPAMPERDNLSLDETVDFLREAGYPLSKARLYKLTSQNKIPFNKFGSKLMFSRSALLNWAKQNTIPIEAIH